MLRCTSTPLHLYSFLRGGRWVRTPSQASAATPPRHLYSVYKGGGVDLMVKDARVKLLIRFC